MVVDLDRPFRLVANLVDGPNALIDQSLISDFRWMTFTQTLQSSLFRYNSPVESNSEEYSSCARNLFGKLMMLLSFRVSITPACQVKQRSIFLKIVRVPMNALDVDRLKSELWGRDPDKFCGKNQISLR